MTAPHPDPAEADLPAAHQPPGGVRLRPPAVWLHLLILVFFLAISGAVVGVSVHRSPGISPFDEMTHADYAYRIAHGQIPAKGGLLAPEIRREAACHGAALSVVQLPKCTLDAAPPASAFGAKGEDYNFGHPPVYYAITGVLARLGDAIVGGSGHFITMARLVGIGWLACAMFVLYLALLKFRVPPLLALTGGALLAACPMVDYASSTVTNDAAAAVGGSIALYYLGVALIEDRVRPIPLFAWTLLITGTKVINSLPFLGLAGLFAVIALLAGRAEDRARAKTYAVATISILAAVLIVYKGWSLYQSGRGVAHWINPILNVSGRKYHGLPFDEWASTLFSGFPPTNDYFLPPVLDGTQVVLWERVLTLVTGAGVLGLLFVFRRGDYRWQFGATLAGALLAFPIIIQIQVFADNRQYFPNIPARYGLSLVPWCIAAVVLIAAWRPFTRSTVVLTLAGLALVMSSYLNLY